jgi:hypothetical protein
VQTVPPPKGSKAKRNATILVIAVLVGSVVVYYFAAGLFNIPSSAMLSGTASVSLAGASAVEVGFTNENTGQSYAAPVVDGGYSIVLPNQQSYTVEIQWSSTSAANGTCDAGTVSVGVGAGDTSLTGDWSC